MFVNRAVDGMLLSPGDFRNISDETSPVSHDEKADKANLRMRLSIQSPTDEDNPVVRGPSGLNVMPMVTDTKPGEISPVKQLVRSPRNGLFKMAGLPCCTW